MKELLKYLTISVLLLLLTIMVIGDAVGQTKLEDVRYNFMGNKARFVFDLSENTAYTVTEDWLDNSLVIDIPNAVPENLERYKTGKWKNYIVEKSQLLRTHSGIRLHIKTRNDFKVKYVTLTKGNRLVFDVYPMLDKPDEKTLQRRALTYENRGHFEKASVIYRQLLEIDPENDEYHRGLDLALSMNGSNDVSEDVQQVVEASLQVATSNANTNGSSEPGQLDVAEQVENTNGAVYKPDNDNTDSVENDLDEIAKLAETLAEDDVNNQQVTHNPAAVAAVISEPGDEDNQDQDSGVFMSVEEILKNSGSDKVILYSLYGVLLVLSVVVFMLIRKLIKEYRVPEKKRKTNGRAGVKQQAVRKRPVSKPAMNSEKQMQEIRSFARKLSDLYAKTETGENGARQSPRPERKKQPDVVQEHTRKIEQIFSEERESMPVDSEALRLIRQYRDKNVESRNTPDKYEVVKQLAAQNWEAWEIARELSMGIEEVKMVMSRDELTNDDHLDKTQYNNVYRLAELNVPPADIAGRLQLDEEQVRLALKLRNRDTSVVGGV